MEREILAELIQEAEELEVMRGADKEVLIASPKSGFTLTVLLESGAGGASEISAVERLTLAARHLQLQREGERYYLAYHQLLGLRLRESMSGRAGFRR